MPMNVAGTARKKAKESWVICVCGMAGSGKSTLAKRLAEKYKLQYYSGGDALKALAIDDGYKNIDRGWWESKEGMRFLEKRSKNVKFDEAVDQKLLELARRGNVVLDSWTMPWLIKKGFKIWLEASAQRRAERIAQRDGTTVREALKALRNKEKQTKAIYKRIYGFDLEKDFAPFNLILDTDSLEAEEVFQVLCTVLDNVLFHGNKNT
jgi:cytidylate kinase